MNTKREKERKKEKETKRKNGQDYVYYPVTLVLFLLSKLDDVIYF